MGPNSISALSKNLGGVISKNSPTILTSLAVGGLISTAILAGKATPKAILLLEEERERIGSLSRRDIIRVSWKVYLPAIGMATATIFCIIQANSINMRRNAALASIYTITDTAFREYQAKIVETIGKNKERSVRDEIASDCLKKNPPGPNEIIVLTDKGCVLCYDTLSGRYFKSSIEHIRQIVNALNKQLMNEMYISLNEFYSELGLAPTKIGDDIGWGIEKGLIDISFSTQLSEDGEPCLVLNYDVTVKYID